MPLYFFSIRNGRYSGASDQGTELADRDAAWNELTGVCAGIIGGISRKLKQNSEWEMELLDESRRPVFRIRLVAESLDGHLDQCFARAQAGIDTGPHTESTSKEKDNCLPYRSAVRPA
jgi:hypothetical protein